MPMYERITPAQKELILESQVFFISSVAPSLSDGPSGEGPVNLSPKGGVPLHIIDDKTVAYVDYPGSGNETSRHSGEDGPCTIMVMSMGPNDSAIVRLYGRARIESIEDSPIKDRMDLEEAEKGGRLRQIVVINVERTQTSCGHGVPVYDFVSQRGKEGAGRRFYEAKDV